MASSDLYAVLGVEKTASPTEIKKAYRMLCLKLHPDKNPDPEANSKFQALNEVYNVLGDAEKRKVYDETGVYGDAIDDSYFDGLSQLAKISPQDIAEFERSYKGSAEESEELKELYTKHRGNMKQVFMYQVCSDEDADSYRFMQILQQGVATGELKPFPVFEKWAKAVEKKGPPSETLLQQKAKDTMDLVALIRNKNRNPGGAASFLEELEAKYVGKGGDKKGAGAKKSGGGKGKGKAVAAESDDVEEEEERSGDDDEPKAKQAKAGGREKKKAGGAVGGRASPPGKSAAAGKKQGKKK